MFKKSIFRTYDIRGIYPSEINEKTVFKISRALGLFFKKGTIVIARDGRLCSPSLYKEVSRGISKTENGKKLKLIQVGLSTTPMFYFLVNKLKASGGIMVTASHNPKNYGGLKVLKEGGEFVNGKQIFKIVSKFAQK